MLEIGFEHRVSATLTDPQLGAIVLEVFDEAVPDARQADQRAHDHIDRRDDGQEDDEAPGAVEEAEVEKLGRGDRG